MPPQSDASDHALPYAEYEGVRYGKLSVTDRARLLREFKAASRADLNLSIKEAGMQPGPAYVELRAHDLAVWGARAWVDLVNSFEGQQRVFATALAKHNPPDAVEGLLADVRLTPAESVERAATLSCLPYDARPQNVPAEMRQVGVIDGRPVFAVVDPDAAPSGPQGPASAAGEKDGAGNPTGNPPAYGKPVG